MMYAICRQKVFRNISTARLRCFTNPRSTSPLQPCSPIGIRRNSSVQDTLMALPAHLQPCSPIGMTRNSSVRDTLMTLPRTTSRLQPCSPIGMRRYSSVRDTLMTLPARLQKIFSSQPDDESTSKRLKEVKSANQKVNLIITEMIQQQTTLEDMLFVTGKLVSKMSLADKAIVQQLLTEKLYSEIVDASPVFIRIRYNPEIRELLLSEGRLDKAVEPLVSSSVFKELVKGMVACTDDMNNWQVTSLFLNLQLLNWDKESKEMFKLFERLYGLDSNEFTVGEMVLFIHGLRIYQRSYKHTFFMFLEWCKYNKVDLNNDHWFEILNLLRDFRPQLRADQNGLQTVFEQIAAMINDEEGDGIAELDLYHSLVLTNILNDERIQEYFLGDSKDILLKKMMNRVRTLIEDIGDREMVYLGRKWGLGWLEGVGDLLGSVIMNKYLKHPIKEDLKYDVLLSVSLLMSSIKSDAFQEMIIGDVVLYEKVIECLKYLNLVSMQSVGKWGYMYFYTVYQDVIIERLHSISKLGVIELDELHYLQKFPCLILNNLSKFGKLDGRRNKVCLETRDRFLEEYLHHYVEHKEFMILGIKLCSNYPKMTPISIIFLEKINLLKGGALISLPTFHFNTFYKLVTLKSADMSFRRDLCKVNYSQSQSALSKLESDSLLLLCNSLPIYRERVQTGSLNLTNYFDDILLEPAMRVLKTETLKRLNGAQESGYKTNIDDSRILLEYIYNNKAFIKGKWIFSVLLVRADCFFNGYRSGDELKVKDIVKYIEPLVKDEALRTVVYEQEVNWHRYMKDCRNFHKKVRMRHYIRKLFWEAFDNCAGSRIFTHDKLFLDIAVLLDASDRPVPFSMQRLEQAEKLGLKKVVFMFCYSSTYMAQSERMVKDLQKAGFKCVVIWNEELKMLGNRTKEGKIRFIKSKLRMENSIINTAPKITYDPERIMKGPYKKYFRALSEEEPTNVATS